MHLGLLFPDLTLLKSDLKVLYTKHPSHRCVPTGIVPVPGSRIIFFETYPVPDGEGEAGYPHEKSRRPDLYLPYSNFLTVHEEWQLKSGHILYPEVAWRGEMHLADSRKYRPVQEFCHRFKQKRKRGRL